MSRKIKDIPISPLLENATDNNVGELISREQAIDEIRKCRFVVDAIEKIRGLPTIQPEIVRCKDCKHWIPYDWMFSEVWRSKNMADYSEDEIGCNWCDMAMKANDFCSRGEKREVTT